MSIPADNFTMATLCQWPGAATNTYILYLKNDIFSFYIFSYGVKRKEKEKKKK